MTESIVKIKGNIFHDFKVGDNVVYNSKILRSLVDANHNGQFNKLIVMQSCSILEACLYETIMRIQNYNIEGYPGLSKEEGIEIKSKKVKDKFAIIIDVLKKYNILDNSQLDVYDNLHTIRRLRNKIHIQSKNLNIDGLKGERDEVNIFTDYWTNFSISLCEKVICYLSETKFRQEGRLDNCIEDFYLPRATEI